MKNNIKIKWVLFGAGRVGMKVYHDFLDYGIVPAYFVDNRLDLKNSKHWNTDIPIYKPEKLLSEDKSNLKIIITTYQPYYAKEIYKQLVDMGFKNCISHGIRPNLPNAVRIDACSLCQLSCPECHMRTNIKNKKNIGMGYLKFDDFKDFLDKHTYIKTVELSCSGEIFLNPQLDKIIKYAFAKEVRLTAYNGVNFNTVSDDMPEILVKYKFDTLTISIDGSSQEIYEKYRCNGNYDVVISNIQKVNKYKQKYNSIYPKLIWQFIVMEHNENDIVRAKKEAKKLGMDISFRLPYTKYKSKQFDMIKKETGLNISTDDFPSIAFSSHIECCKRLWTQPQINWNGYLLCSSGNLEIGFGINVFEKGLENAINTSNYKYAQDMVQGIVPPLTTTVNIPCVSCQHYKTMLETGVFIVFDDV